MTFESPSSFLRNSIQVSTKKITTSEYICTHHHSGFFFIKKKLLYSLCLLFKNRPRYALLCMFNGCIFELVFNTTCCTKKKKHTTKCRSIHHSKNLYLHHSLLLQSAPFGKVLLAMVWVRNCQNSQLQKTPWLELNTY